MHSAAPGVISSCRWTISCLSSRATRTANSDRKFKIGCALLLDMEVIVRRQDHACCASITCMIRHYVARRAKVIEDHPHNAAERVSAGQCHLSFSLLSAWSRLPVGRTAAMSDKPVSGTPSRGSNGAAAGALLAGFVVLPQTSVNPAPSGSPAHVTRDRDPRGDGWVAPLWWTDGVGQADPSHLRLRRT